MNCAISEEPSIKRPIEAEAYELALRDISSLHSDAHTREDVRDIIMTAILDLRKAGQTNPEMLSRYAVGRADALLRSTKR